MPLPQGGERGCLFHSEAPPGPGFALSNRDLQKSDSVTQTARHLRGLPEGIRLEPAVTIRKQSPITEIPRNGISPGRLNDVATIFAHFRDQNRPYRMTRVRFALDF